MCDHVHPPRTVVVCDDVPTGDLAGLVSTVAEFGGGAGRIGAGRIGDRRLAFTFGCATSAIAAAVEMQRMRRESGRAGLAIGVDHGAVDSVRGVGPIGLAAHVAAVLAGRCAPGEIAATDRVVDRLEAPLPAATVSTATTTVDGLDGRQLVHVVTAPTGLHERRRRAQAMASPTASSTP